MSDPVTNVEIEDVLSSIRRLVSEDRPSKPVPSENTPRDPEENRLVLTPALRVSDDDTAPGNKAEGPFPLTSDIAVKPAPAAPWPPQQVELIPEDADLTVDDADIATGAPAVSEDAPDPLPDHATDLQTDPEPWSDAAVEVSEDSPARDDDIAAHDAVEDMADAPQDGVVDQVAAGPDGPGDFAEPADAVFAPYASNLEDPIIDEPEPAIEPEPMIEPEPDIDLDPSRADDGALLLDTPVESAVDTVEEAPADPDEPVAAPERVAVDAEPALAFAEAPTPDWTPAPMESVDETVETPDPSAPVAENEDDEIVEAEAWDESAILDEEALREMVADIVRQELQGALGERITRNVRKLVRREIHRALAAQELD